MPLFESPKDESDGGYAVSDFRKIDKRSALTDLKKFRNKCSKKHVPDDGYCAESYFTQHEWAKKQQGVIIIIRIITISTTIEGCRMNLINQCRKYSPNLRR